jgi:uncharacterized protein (DUF433 family)
MADLEHILAEKPPLQKDEDGVFRVGGTRVRLDTVITTFQNGCTAEEILLKYPSLNLPDIYSVLAYYLHHREDVDAYLKKRKAIIAQAEREIEERHPSAEIRERLLSRRRPAA